MKYTFIINGNKNEAVKKVNIFKSNTTFSVRKNLFVKKDFNYTVFFIHFALMSPIHTSNSTKIFMGKNYPVIVMD